MRFQNVCVAGTFDGLHRGHEALLKRAFAEGETVLIGLTSDAFVSESKANAASVAPYKVRQSALMGWLRTRAVLDRATIVRINDPYEPAVSLPDVAALVVSKETKPRADELNRRREASGLKPVTLIVVPMRSAQDGKPISSTRVRNGEVDERGRLILPVTLRDTLAQPLGRVIPTSAVRSEIDQLDNTRTLITVGDLTTKSLLDAGITPDLMIVDNKVERKKFTELQPIFKKRAFSIRNVVSGPGYMSSEAIRLVQLILQKHQPPVVIEVDGEEDLLALPVIASAPVGALVFYGQPPMSAWACGPMTQGVVEVSVTKDTQREAFALMSQFLRS